MQLDLPDGDNLAALKRLGNSDLCREAKRTGGERIVVLVEPSERRVRIEDVERSQRDHRPRLEFHPVREIDSRKRFDLLARGHRCSAQSNRIGSENRGATLIGKAINIIDLQPHRMVAKFALEIGIALPLRQRIGRCLIVEQADGIERWLDQYTLDRYAPDLVVDHISARDARCNRSRPDR